MGRANKEGAFAQSTTCVGRRVRPRLVVTPEVAPGVAPVVAIVAQGSVQEEEEKDEELDQFAAHFDVEMTPAMVARAQEIEAAALLLEISNDN